MNLAGDADALLFTHGLQVGRQGAQLLMGGAQVLLNPLALGDVAEEHQGPMVTAPMDRHG